MKIQDVSGPALQSAVGGDNQCGFSLSSQWVHGCSEKVTHRKWQS